MGPPFFNRWMVPIGLMLLLLTGVGPLLAWRKSTLGNLREQFLWPVVCGLVTGGPGGARRAGVEFGRLLCLAGFVIGDHGQEMLRGANVRRGMTGTDLFTAWIGLVGRNKRRYGGYIVHAGIVFICLGFAGQGFSTDEQLLLKPGQEAQVGDYKLHLDAIRVTDDSQKQMITAHITVTGKNGQSLGQMEPAKWFYRKHEEEPTTEVAIRRSFAEDLYIVMPAFELEQQTASVEVHVNPLVNWVWMGFGILAIGTGLALLPEGTLRLALAKVPSEAVTAAMLILALVLFPVAASAQHDVPAQGSQLQVFTPKVREMTKKLACWCGGCSRLPVGVAPAVTARR